MLNMQEKLAPIYNQRSMINIFFFNYLIGGLSKATSTQKAGNAVASIRQFYVFVINGVSIV